VKAIKYGCENNETVSSSRIFHKMSSSILCDGALFAYSHHWTLRSWLDQLLKQLSSRMRHPNCVDHVLPTITLLTTALTRRCSAVMSVTNSCGASFDKAIVAVVSWRWHMIYGFSAFVFETTCCVSSGTLNPADSLTQCFDTVQWASVMKGVLPVTNSASSV